MPHLPSRYTNACSAPCSHLTFVLVQVTRTIENTRLPDQTTVLADDPEVLGDEADDEFSAISKPKILVPPALFSCMNRSFIDIMLLRLRQDQSVLTSCFRSLEI
jgi:hypothetical protein